MLKAFRNAWGRLQGALIAISGRLARASTALRTWFSVKGNAMFAKTKTFVRTARTWLSPKVRAINARIDAWVVGRVRSLRAKTKSMLIFMVIVGMVATPVLFIQSSMPKLNSGVLFWFGAALVAIALTLLIYFYIRSHKGKKEEKPAAKTEKVKEEKKDVPKKKDEKKEVGIFLGLLFPAAVALVIGYIVAKEDIVYVWVIPVMFILLAWFAEGANFKKSLVYRVGYSGFWLWALLAGIHYWEHEGKLWADSEPVLARLAKEVGVWKGVDPMTLAPNIRPGEGEKWVAAIQRYENGNLPQHGRILTGTDQPLGRDSWIIPSDARAVRVDIPILLVERGRTYERDTVIHLVGGVCEVPKSASKGLLSCAGQWNIDGVPAKPGQQGFTLVFESRNTFTVKLRYWDETSPVGLQFFVRKFAD